ncbi:MAG: FtsL-like putative cell division protein [Flavobacteriales bacterium]
MNTLRKEESPPARPLSKKKKGRMLQKVLNGEFLAREGLINHLPFISFLAVLFLLHIALMYYFEQTQVDISRKQKELNETRSAYNTTMSDLERSRQQSSVAESIEQIGLRELRTPPQVIDVEKGFLTSE